MSFSPPRQSSIYLPIFFLHSLSPVLIVVSLPVFLPASIPLECPSSIPPECPLSLFSLAPPPLKNVWLMFKECEYLVVKVSAIKKILTRLMQKQLLTSVRPQNLLKALVELQEQLIASVRPQERLLH